MRNRTLRTRRLGFVTAAVALAGASLIACGDSSDDSKADPATEADNSGGTASPNGDGDGEDTVRNPSATPSGDAGATVEIDGTTYQFRPMGPDVDSDIYTYCTVVADSLQGGMVLVDDSGAPIEGGELEFILLEPGGVYEASGDPAELRITLPGHDAGYLAEEIDAPASGSSASGTFTVSNGLGDSLSGTIDASC